jgi:hypothetical protein
MDFQRLYGTYKLFRFIKEKKYINKRDWGVRVRGRQERTERGDREEELKVKW